MILESAQQIQHMSVDDVLNALGLSGVLLYFLTPTICVALIAYAYRRHKFKKKLKAAKAAKAAQAAQKKTTDIDENALIEDLPDKPEDIGKFSSLSLEFNQDGHVK